MTETAIQVIGLLGMAVVAFVFAGGMLPLIILLVSSSCEASDRASRD